MAQTVLDKLNRVPPCVCRLLARKNHGRRGMTHRDLAKASGLTLSTVQALSFRRSWTGLSIDTIMAFSLACGVNHLSTDQQMDYLRRRRMAHVLGAKGSQKVFYARLLTSGR
jgi:hypothetical protein